VGIKRIPVHLRKTKQPARVPAARSDASIGGAGDMPKSACFDHAIPGKALSDIIPLTSGLYKFTRDLSAKNLRGGRQILLFEIMF
jgi:hypothetical protein